LDEDPHIHSRLFYSAYTHGTHRHHDRQISIKRL
jgi:hypothetical protein